MDDWDGTVGDDDLVLVSASTISGIVPSPGLDRWKYKEAVKYMFDDFEFVDKLVQRVGHDAAVDAVMEAPFSYSRTGGLTSTQRGTEVHNVMEAWMMGKPTPDYNPEVKPYVDTLFGWVKDNKPTPISMEEFCYHPELGIGGRYDLICELGGKITLLDLKTATRSVNPYADKYCIQLAAYRHATHVATWEPRIVAKPGRRYLVSEAEHAHAEPMIEVERGVILQVTPSKAQAYEMDSGPEILAVAAAARELWMWTHFGHKDTVKQKI